MLSSLAVLNLGSDCVMPQRLAQITPDTTNIPPKGPFVFDRMETELDITSLVNKGRHAFSQIQLPASHAAKLALCIKSE